MNGELAQLIAITSYGNHFLNNGNILDDFYPTNTTFLSCETVEFVEYRESFFFSKEKEKVVATTPTNWFKKLKKGGCRKLRLYFQFSEDQSLVQDHKMAGMLGGGGNWLIEAIYEDYSDFWIDRWILDDNKSANQTTWKVSYILLESLEPIINLQFDLETAKGNLNQTLTKISDFASQHNFQEWVKVFEEAKAILFSTNPIENYYFHDIIDSVNYSLTAQQVLFAAGRAWVFGGMGSWNDISFDNEEDNIRYEELSAELYNKIIQSIIASVNSF